MALGEGEMLGEVRALAEAEGLRVAFLHALGELLVVSVRVGVMVPLMLALRVMDGVAEGLLEVEGERVELRVSDAWGEVEDSLEGLGVPVPFAGVLVGLMLGEGESVVLAALLVMVLVGALGVAVVFAALPVTVLVGLRAEALGLALEEGHMV